MRAFAEAEKIEAKDRFSFSRQGKKGIQIDDVKPGRLISKTGRKLGLARKDFEGLTQAAEKSVYFESVMLNVGQGNQMIALHIGEIRLKRHLSKCC